MSGKSSKWLGRGVALWCAGALWTATTAEAAALNEGQIVATSGNPASRSSINGGTITVTSATHGGSAIVADGGVVEFNNVKNVDIVYDAASGANDRPDFLAENGGQITISDCLLTADSGQSNFDAQAKDNGSLITINDSTFDLIDVGTGAKAVINNSVAERGVFAGRDWDDTQNAWVATKGTIEVNGGTLCMGNEAWGQGTTVTLTGTQVKGDGSEHTQLSAAENGVFILKGNTQMTTPSHDRNYNETNAGHLQALSNGVINIGSGQYGTPDCDIRLITDLSNLGDSSTPGTINLKGGKLYAHNFTDLAPKSLVLSGTGELVTTSWKIFEKGIGDNGGPNVPLYQALKSTDCGGIHGYANGNSPIVYNGGTLALDDGWYTQAYVDSAKAELAKADNGTTKLHMLGQPVTASSKTPYSGPYTFTSANSPASIDDKIVYTGGGGNTNINVHSNGSLTVTNSDLGSVCVGYDVTDSPKFPYTGGAFAMAGGSVNGGVEHSSRKSPMTLTDVDFLSGYSSVDAYNASTVNLLGSTAMPSGGCMSAYASEGDNVPSVINIKGGQYGDPTHDVKLETFNRNWSFKKPGVINLMGGRLYAHDFGSVGTAYLTEKALVLSGAGELVTRSGKVFANDIGGKSVTAADALKATDSGAVTNRKIKYDGGTILLDDAYYTEGYMKTARTALTKVDSGKTAVHMLGSLVGGGTPDSPYTPTPNVPAPAPAPEEPTVIEQMPVTSFGDDTYQHQVTGTTGGQNLVVGVNADAVINATTVDKSFGAKNLDLGDGNTVAINNNRTLELYHGNDEGELIASEAGAVSVNVSGGGALVLGSTYESGTGGISGTVTVDTNGTFKVAGGDYRAASVSLNNNGQLTVEGGRLSIASLVASTASAAARILVGTANAPGRLSVSSLALNGNLLFLDPVWSPSLGVNGASQAAVVFPNNSVDGKAVVGRNGLLALGTEDESLARQAFETTGQRWGKDAVSAALYIHKPQTIGSGGLLVVDGTLDTETKANAQIANRFAKGSLLIANAAAIGSGQAILDGTAAVSVASGAKLAVLNAKENDTVRILDAGITLTGVWDTASVYTNALSKATFNPADNTVTMTRAKARDAFGNGITLPNALDKMAIDTNGNNPGAAYLSALIDGQPQGSPAGQRLVDSAAQLAQTVGMAKNAIDIAQNVADSIDGHLSLASESLSEIRGQSGQASRLWIQYLRDNTTTDELDLAGAAVANYKSQYNGFVVGADLKATTNSRHGLALAHGEGKAHGYAARNDFDFWGVSYYGNVNDASRNLMWDIGYTKVENDIKGMGLSMDPHTSAFTVGARVEQKFAQGSNAFTPYVGLRYMSVDSGEYDGRTSSGTAFHYDAGRQNVFLLPIGVNFANLSQSKNGWKWRTSLDLSYTLNLGKTRDDLTVTVPGLGVSDSFDYDFTERGAFVASLGFAATHDRWSIGIGYSRREGTDSHSDRLYAKVAMSF